LFSENETSIEERNGHFKEQTNKRTNERSKLLTKKKKKEEEQSILGSQRIHEEASRTAQASEELNVLLFEQETRLESKQPIRLVAGRFRRELRRTTLAEAATSDENRISMKER
jgi:hypothetical protein